MFRCVLLAVFLAVPLSYASSGGTAEDDSPVQTTERQDVDYTVSCGGTDDSFASIVDCQFDVTYRTSEGMKKENSYAANQFWSGFFGAVSGDTAVMTVERKAGTGGRLYLAIWVDRHREAFHILDGVGPATLKAVIP